jgi:Chlorite dismutase
VKGGKVAAARHVCGPVARCLQLYAFSGGAVGEWRVESISTIRGEGLPTVPRLQVAAGDGAAGAVWVLRGVTSNERYTTKGELAMLRARQESLGRPDATCAALIPITKSPAWWELAQDERRAIFEERSHHIAVGSEYLPDVARRLHHGRELGEAFDFLTWFEFSPAVAPAFDELVSRLRASEEWRYVEREIDIRVVRGDE